jgi:hypothetical protein
VDTLRYQGQGARLLACGIVVAGLAGVVLALAGSGSPFRSPLVLLFLVTAPAMAVAGLLRGLDVVARVFVSCLAMIVINACVAETMLAAGAWSPKAGLLAVVVIAAVLWAVQLPFVRGLARRYASSVGGVFARVADRLERM